MRRALVLASLAANVALAFVIPRVRAHRRAERRRRSLQLHDDIVQGLTTVCWALEAGSVEQAREAALATQRRAQALTTALLEEDVVPGSLRRSG
jgi:hypothetical protein